MMSETILLLQIVLIFLISSLVYQEILCTNVKWIHWNRWSLNDVTFGTPMAILKGSISLQMCVVQCQYTPYCVSVHVNKTSFQCELSSYYPPEKTLPAKTRTGWNVFYKADLVNDACYNFTSKEINNIFSNSEVASKLEVDVCQSYPYTVHTAGKNGDYPNSGGCFCVQTKGCYVSSTRNYQGTWYKTLSGFTCQRWDSQTPHTHQMISSSMFPQDGSASEALYYCRDPDNTGELWCFTTNPEVRSEICGIPKCSP